MWNFFVSVGSRWKWLICDVSYFFDVFVLMIFSPWKECALLAFICYVISESITMINIVFMTRKKIVISELYHWSFIISPTHESVTYIFYIKIYHFYSYIIFRSSLHIFYEIIDLFLFFRLIFLSYFLYFDAKQNYLKLLRYIETFFFNKIVKPLQFFNYAISVD